MRRLAILPGSHFALRSLAMAGLTLAGLALAAGADRQASRLVAPPPGSTLPVYLVKGLKAQSVSVGQPVVARFYQRVPVSAGTYLSPKVEIVGHFMKIDPSSVSILFTELRWKGQTVPVHVRLLAAASSKNVFRAGFPLAAGDRGNATPADWTTRQIGGDQVYRSAGAGKVYNRYSQPVGFVDLNGVYKDPSSPGELARAMGPFSTTATGLHGLPDFSIVSPGDAASPITLGVSQPGWKIAAGGALLLEVVR